ncbi:MAG: hypothetical protein ACYDCL_20920 [Myxococcales bacterium]
MKSMHCFLVAASGCGLVNGDVSATVTTSDATAKFSGALLHVNPGGPWGSAGKQFTFNFAAAQVDFQPSDGSTFNSFSVEFDTQGAVQAKTYDATGSDSCFNIVYHYNVSADVGTDFYTDAAANSICTGSGDGSWSVEITDASAPHGTITATMVDVNKDDRDPLRGSTGNVTITF